MQSDLDSARAVELRPVVDVAGDIGLGPDDLELYGRYKAKMAMHALKRLLSDEGRKRGKLVLVTAITPTKAGEGKTTVCIGLAQALSGLGAKSICAIRQPSLGPVFGIKGGATGGGCSQVLPMEEINLHFTGDLHAIAAANNLLAAMVDNHLFHKNVPVFDSRSASFRRALDMNDRSLRKIITGLGGKSNGYPMETGCDITAASEVMALLCLSDSIADLKARLGRIVVGQSPQGEPITANEIGAAGAMAVLLKDAIKPNLVQTMEGTPAFVHGGPFANIAHGCSSVVATRLALKLAEFVVTEAGFGADLGFEKFCHIVAAPSAGNLLPDAVVLVATVRALKLHGGVKFDALHMEDVGAVKRGLPNLARHAGIIAQFGMPFVVAINRFASDCQAEIAAVESFCLGHNWPVAACDAFKSGGAGAADLAAAVKRVCDLPGKFAPLYDAQQSIKGKLESLAVKVYGAETVELSAEAERQLAWLEKHGYGRLPTCVAKTQYSLSDDPDLLSAPVGFKMHVREFHLSAGAGFVVAQMGELTTMPGLPKQPAALYMDIDENGRISRFGPS